MKGVLIDGFMVWPPAMLVATVFMNLFFSFFPSLALQEGGIFRSGTFMLYLSG